MVKHLIPLITPKRSPDSLASSHFVTIPSDAGSLYEESVYSKSMADTVATKIDELVEQRIHDMEDIMYSLNGTEAGMEDIGMGMDEIYRLSKKVAYSEEVAIKSDCNDVDDESINPHHRPKVMRYKLNKDCMTDPFVTGRMKIKNVKSERTAELAEHERKIRMIHLSVEHFVEKRRKDEDRLKNRNDSPTVDEYEEWEVMIQESMKKFDIHEYRNSANK